MGKRLLINEWPEETGLTRKDLARIIAPILPNRPSIHEQAFAKFVLATMNKKDRGIIHAYFYQNKTYAQLGKKYNVSPTAVHKRIKHILTILQKTFNPQNLQ